MATLWLHKFNAISRRFDEVVEAADGLVDGMVLITSRANGVVTRAGRDALDREGEAMQSRLRDMLFSLTQMVQESMDLVMSADPNDFLDDDPRNVERQLSTSGMTPSQVLEHVGKTNEVMREEVELKRTLYSEWSSEEILSFQDFVEGWRRSHDLARETVQYSFGSSQGVVNNDDDLATMMGQI